MSGTGISAGLSFQHSHATVALHFPRAREAGTTDDEWAGPFSCPLKTTLEIKAIIQRAFELPRVCAWLLSN